jgi:acyl carrier protein
VTSEARQAIAELERRGAQVQVFRADIADEAALRQVLAEIGAAGMMLRGIVHAAGLPGRCALAELDTPALEGMFAAKVAGSWALHRATRDLELDFFVCCSSMVSLWGAREQGHYVAANHFVDALAHYRRSLGLPALSVNWGPLSGGGMLPAADVAELARIGVFATPLVEAPSALAHLLATQAVQAAPVHIDWPLFRAVYQTRGRCRLFDQVAIAPSTAPRTAPVLDQLRSAAQSERREILVEHVQTTLARVLGLDASRRPDAQQGFFDIGMDSLTAMELCTQLQDSLGATLPSTLAFDYGTVDALVDFLLRSTFAQPQALPAAPARDAGTTDTGAGGAIGLDGIARMTDAEVEILLLAKLNDPVRV